MNCLRTKSCVRPRLSLAAAMLFAACGLMPASAAETKVHFNRDVRPILADNCFACHGPDANKRKAGLRLDTREGLFEKTPKHDPAIVPGQLEKSELWARVTTKNEDDLMPPPDSHKKLSLEQIELLKRWILEGAPWQGHWAFVKPERPAVPTKFKTPASKFPIRNPIDAFILAALEKNGLQPNAEADRRSLARRVSLDMTGLPPTPNEVQTFAGDKAKDAYLKFVRRLMATPHYGEHRARYWLDAARYADTHGLHFDNYREIWPYRDWVIKALNRNMPFDQFTIEQIAGDLLEGAGDDERTATGFHRCNLTTNEGGTIEDENLANYANDRVTTTSWVWLGLTMNCAACHDHKFDPISTKDFYSMAAFFRNTKQSGFDKNIRESDLFMVAPQTEADRNRWHALTGEIESARAARVAQETAADAEFTNWLAKVQEPTLNRNLEFAGDYVRLPLNDALSVDNGSTAPEQVAAMINGLETKLEAAPKMAWTNAGPFGAAPLLTKEHSITVGHHADFESREPFSLGAWVFVPKDFKGEGALIAKMAGEPEKYRGWEVFLRDKEFGFKVVHRWSSVAMEVRSAESAVKPGEWQHIFVTYDGSERTPGVRLFVNGAEAKATRENNRLEWSIRNSHPLRIGRREIGSELKNVAVQDVRINKRRLSSTEVRAIAAAPRIVDSIRELRNGGTNEATRALVRDYFRVAIHAGWREAHRRLAALEAEQQAIRSRSPRTLVQEEKKDSMPTAAILFRGEYDKPRDKVIAATPAVLHQLPAGAPTNRLGLAKWIVSSENPLTARVTVNRLWQEIFGAGLVKTADDFGLVGEQPSHPELLDWLAVEFQESGWNIKHIIELMVTSSTYRQSQEVSSDKLEKDPQNRLLSRGPRFRMDAEMIRDSALAVSGLLVKKVGGPPVKPYQPDGIWEAIAMPESNTRSYSRDAGESLYRRSMYTFWKRAAPPATMDILNAPSREVCTVKRERTNTPLQALVTLNDPQFVEAARNLAQAALLRGKPEDEAIQFMAEQVLSRPLTATERNLVKESFLQMLAYYEQHSDAAKQLISVGESKANPEVPLGKLAAMTLVANQIMNLDEALNK